MHEIKPIASHTSPKEPSPLQPKTSDEFTNILDELLGDPAAPIEPDPIKDSVIPPNTCSKHFSLDTQEIVQPDGLAVPNPTPDTPDEPDAKIVPPAAIEGADVQLSLAEIIGKRISMPAPDYAESAAERPANPLIFDRDSPVYDKNPRSQPPLPGVTPDITMTGPYAGPAVEPLLKFQMGFPGPGAGIGGLKPAAAAKSAAAIALERPNDGQTLPVNVTGLLAAVHPHDGVIAPISESSAAAISSSVASPEPAADERLNLGDFEVTRFEYKTEIETRLFPDLHSAQVMQMVRTSMPAREFKPVKPAGSDSDILAHDGSSQSEPLFPAPAIASPGPVEHVRLVFEPPLPPPVIRTVSMDIGEAESQVRVVIRERNGNLNVQFGSANERLRMDLQTSGPLLMRELQRNSPVAVTLDFTNFGSATDTDSHPRSQPQAKKSLKSDADFADVAETAHLPQSLQPLKSL